MAFSSKVNNFDLKHLPNSHPGGMQLNSVEAGEANAMGIRKGWSREGAWISSSSVVCCVVSVLFTEAFSCCFLDHWGAHEVI